MKQEKYDFKDILDSQKKKTEAALNNLGFSEKSKNTTFSGSLGKAQISAQVNVKVGK